MRNWTLIFAVGMAAWVFPVQAQDLEVLVERVNRLAGHVQDLQEDNANLKRQIETLVRENQALREQINVAPKTSGASQEDLRELARKVQEVEDKRKADRELILREIKDLGRVMSSATANTTARSPRGASNEPTAKLPKEAIEHTIASGDTLLAIAVAYSKETGKKITTDLILRANSGLKAERLIVGRKILIPIPDK